MIRGRRFTAATLRVIRRCVSQYSDRGRTYISAVVCRRLNWRQPNGWLKDRACREALSRLDAAGIIKLPPRRALKKPHYRRPLRVGRSLFKPSDHVHDDLTLAWAKGNKLESTWNQLVQNHHYLGHKVIVGRCIKYLVKKDEQVVAAISFSSAAWNLEDRDIVLAEIGVPPWDMRDLVINNSRYLLLCKKGTPNMASRILAFATSRIADDWHRYYAVRPQVVETFVEPSRFEGTCYKAANWVFVGRTRGFRKTGSSHRNSQLPKLVFLYGLSSGVRNRLCAIGQRYSEDPTGDLSDG